MSNPLEIPVKLDAGQFQKTLDAINQKLDSLNSKAKQTESSTSSMFKGMLGANAVTSAFHALVGGIEKSFEAGMKLFGQMEDLKLGFSQAGLKGAELDAQLKLSGKNIDELSSKYAISKGRLRELTAQNALMTGAAGPQNDSIVKLASGIEEMTHGAVNGEMVIRAFGKGLNDPEAQASLGRLSMKLPQLATALKGIKDPAEMTKAALATLQPAFDNLEERANGPEGSMKKFNNAMLAIKSTVGVTLVTALAPFLEMLGKPEMTKVFKDIATSIASFLGPAMTQLVPILKQIIPIFADILKGAAANIPVIGSLLTSVIPIVADLLNALMPMIKLLNDSLSEPLKVLISALADGLKPIIPVIASIIKALAPTIVSLAGVFGEFVKALAPFIKEQGQMLADLLVEMVPLFIALSDILVDLAPLITLQVRAMAAFMTIGSGIILAVVKPIISAISWIIENGAKAADFVAKIFGASTNSDQRNKQAATSAQKNADDAVANMINKANEKNQKIEKIEQEHTEKTEKHVQKRSVDQKKADKERDDRLKEELAYKKLLVDNMDDGLGKLKANLELQLDAIDKSDESKRVKEQERLKANREYEKAKAELEKKAAIDALDHDNKLNEININAIEDEDIRNNQILANRGDYLLKSLEIGKITREQYDEETAQLDFDVKKLQKQRKQMAMGEELAHQNAILKKEAEKTESIVGLLNDSLSTIGKGLGDVIAGKVSGLKDMLKGILTAMIDFVEKQWIVAEAAATIRAFMTFGTSALADTWGWVAGLVALEAAKAAVNSFEVGSWNTPKGLAMLHDGEIVIPNKGGFADSVRKGEATVTGTGIGKGTSSTSMRERPQRLSGSLDIYISNFSRATRDSEFELSKGIA